MPDFLNDDLLERTAHTETSEPVARHNSRNYRQSL
jgi:hypothetical protein